MRRHWSFEGLGGLLALTVALGCPAGANSISTADAGAGGNGGTSGTGGAGGGGGSDAGANADVPIVEQRIRVRFLQAYLRQGVKGAFDIGAGDREGRWSVLTRNVAYGTLTDYFEVLVDPGHYAYFWFVPPGSDPANFGRGDEINFLIASDATGPHTLFFHYTDDVTHFAGQLVRDDDPSLALPSGYAYLAFNTGAIRGFYPMLDYGQAGSCVDRATQDNYKPLTVGTYTFALYDGASATGCQGTRIVSAPATALASGDVWMLYAIGDSTNGFELRPVKFTR